MFSYMGHTGTGELNLTRVVVLPSKHNTSEGKEVGSACKGHSIRVTMEFRLGKK